MPMLAQEEEARELVAAMVEANGLESLVLRLGNLDEGVAEEDAAVLNALSTLENMIELQPSVPAPAQLQCASALICQGVVMSESFPQACVVTAPPCARSLCSIFTHAYGIGTFSCPFSAPPFFQLSVSCRWPRRWCSARRCCAGC